MFGVFSRGFVMGAVSTLVAVVAATAVNIAKDEYGWEFPNFGKGGFSSSRQKAKDDAEENAARDANT